MSQKIIIPKGLINPDETTIIEIPEEVQDIETVVAKPVYLDGGESSDDVFECLYPEEGKLEPRIKYIEEVYDEEDCYCYRKPSRRRSASSYPVYQCFDRNASYYSYSNCVSTPLVNFDEDFEDKDMLSLVSQTSRDCTVAKKLTTKEVISVLDMLEKVELKRLCKNLKEYQGARRRLLFETANIHTFDDINASLSGLY